MSEVDETMKRLQSHKGVTGLIVIDKEGKNIKILTGTRSVVPIRTICRVVAGT